MRRLLSRLWHYFSVLLLIYGYYLVFLFFLDTFLRVFGSKFLAFLVSGLLTLVLIGVALVFIYKDKILEKVRNA
ncbi:MAG: hypothetical protein GXN96_05685 [Aquificae bacterium]|nr:hypothetical protein [Aquificota bacterium]